MKKRKPITRKIGQKSHDRSPGDAEGTVQRAAVSKHHPMFGALKGLVHIAPGTDLTDPADPEWGDPGET